MGGGVESKSALCSGRGVAKTVGSPSVGEFVNSNGDNKANKANKKTDDKHAGSIILCFMLELAS